MNILCHANYNFLYKNITRAFNKMSLKDFAIINKLGFIYLIKDKEHIQVSIKYNDMLMAKSMH